jgi:hypothetical protein
MQNPSEYLKYAENCERMAKSGPVENRQTLLKIAEAWRQCAAEAMRRNKQPLEASPDES